VIRLRLFLERIGWKRITAAVLAVAVLAAAGAVFAVTRGSGDKESATPPTTTSAAAAAAVYYLRAVAPKQTVTGCSMMIRFTWKPDYAAAQYAGATAVIVVSGADVQGGYRRRFTRQGVSLDVGPVSLAGGYKTWSARVESIDGDPPGNETTVYAAPPQNSKCE
jgi:hypothetical protein